MEHHSSDDKDDVAGENKKFTLMEPYENDDIIDPGQDEDDNDDDDDDWMGYIPSISDRLHIGYYRMDRACQTEESDLINLKQLSDLLALVTIDIGSLKKSLYYAKLTLQAEYDGRLQDGLAALYSRINVRIAEIEAMHHERINVLRRSYRTQLSNALCKLSRDYHRYYGRKDADTRASHIEEVNELEQKRLESRKNELLHQEMAEMLKIKAEDGNSSVEDEISSRDSVVSVTKYTTEIEDLNNSVVMLESKVEYLEDMLDETNEDNSKLNTEVDQLTTQLNEEEEKTKRLQQDISIINKKMVKERFAAQERLNQQKEKLKSEMDSKIQATQQKLKEESAKQVEEMKRNETEKLQQQKNLEEIKIQELMNKREEVAPVQQVVHHDTTNFQKVIDSQQEEISRLQKELQRKTRLWEMKVKILQEHIHVLKDEMFLRTTLQRQSAKLGHASLTYAKQGLQEVPLGVNTMDVKTIERKHRLPTIIQAPRVVQETCDDVVVEAQMIANYCK